MQRVNLYLQRILSIFEMFERHAELEKLIVWAKRKHLSRVSQTYITRLLDEEQRLFRAKIIFPYLTYFAELLHTFKQQLFHTPQYYKGYAAKYKRNSLTREAKKTYSYK